MTHLNPFMVTDYFLHFNISTVILFTCAPEDELKWLKHTFSGKSGIYSGRGLDDLNLDVKSFAMTYRKLGIFFDLDCDKNKRILPEINKHNVFNDTYVWLFWSGALVPDDLKSLPLALNSYSEARFALEHSGYVQFYDVYKIKFAPELTEILAGTWNFSNGLLWYLSASKYGRRIDLGGLVLQAGLVVLDFNRSIPDLFTKLRNFDDEKTKDPLPRVTWILWDILQEIHNFSINITMIDSYGYQRKSDGSYEGLLGAFQLGLIDMSLGGIGMFTYRMEFVSFNNIRFWSYRTVFVFLQPRTLERSTLLINPFSGAAWLGSMSVILAAVILIAIISNFDSSIRISIGSALLYMCAIFSQQGAVLTSRWWSGRALLFTSLIFGYILFNYYSGQVVSELLSPPSITITNLKQIAESSFSLASQHDSPYLRIRYNTVKTHSIPELGRIVNRTGGFVPAEEGIQRVRNGYYAIEVEDTKAYLAIEQIFTEAEKCYLGDVPMPTVDSYFAFRKNSEFKELFSISIIQMCERGMIKRIHRQWKQPRPQCTGLTNLTPVDLVNASVAFYILFTGALLGCSLYFLELLASNRFNIFKKLHQISTIKHK